MLQHTTRKRHTYHVVREEEDMVRSRAIPKSIETPVMWYREDGAEDGEVVFDEEGMQDAFQAQLRELMNTNPSTWEVEDG